MITQRTLLNLINKGLSTREIASLLSYSQSNVKYFLKKYNLKTKWSGKIDDCFCKTCGETNPDKFYKRKNKTISRKQCARCWNKRTRYKNKKNKLQAVEYKGGKCILCGYSKCSAALAFHHRDPKQKDLNWKTLRNMSFNKIKTELDKCELVCHNCHSEIHWDLDNF